MELFDNFLLELLKDLPKTDLLKIYRMVNRVHLKKNEVYIPNGVYCPKVFYVKKGLVRGYYISESGEEKTIFMRWQNEFGADPHSFFDKKPARLCWEALEDSHVLEINSDTLDELTKKSMFLLKVRLHYERKLLKRMYERIEDFVIYSHEERFKALLRKYPDMCERIPDKHLASYLGITAVSLSRIKKRILEKN